MIIRPEVDADVDAVREVVTAAFDGDAEARLVERIRASPEYVPETALVAVVGERIVGHVMVSAAALRRKDRERRIVMLSPLAVAPAHQRRGIGAALVTEVCRLTDDIGEPLVVLEGSPAYYGRLGFRPASTYGLELPLPAWAPPEAAQVKPLAAYDPHDRSLRGSVVYPPAFDGL